MSTQRANYNFKSFLAAPMTPKRLYKFTKTSLNSPSDQESKPFNNESAEAAEKKRPQTTKSRRPRKGPESPIPEFAREYVHGLSDSRKIIGKSLVSSRLQSKNSFRPNMQKDPGRSSKQISQQRSKSNLEKPEKKASTIHEILNLYHPLVMHFTNKAKIRVFTTETLAVQRSKARLERNLQLLNQQFRRKVKEPESLPVEVCEQIRELPKPYDRPALTFGEKLWRLNEVSFLNIKE